MLGPRNQIRLVRSIQLVVIVLLLIAAFGISSDFVLLDALVAIGFLLLALLAFLMKHPRIAVGALALAIVFNQILPLHFEHSTWVIIDIIALVALIYGTYWATDPHKKGTRFEKYVSTLFPSPHFVIVDRTRDNSKTLNRLVLSDSRPDFIFRNQKTNATFAVECKWRVRWAQVGTQNERGIWWDLEQSAHYREFEEAAQMPVYVALGIGGTPEKPAEVFFLELDKLTTPFLSESLVRRGKTATELS